MGITSTMRFLSGGIGGNLLIAAKLLPEVTRLVRKRSKAEIAAALEGDEAMTEFAKKLYSELSPTIRQQVPEAGFIGVVLQNRVRLMGKKKNQEKVKKATS